ncbi:MAG: MerC domain-containing protein [Candidatus Obscuribacterales bacterium]|nr:MerC domain-containing protein [Candidatus Obscuribacterales bacterium]
MTPPVEKSVDACAHDSCGHASGEHQHNHSHADGSTCASAAISAEPQAGQHVPETIFSRVVGLMDIAGVFASTLCTIHCLLLPIVVALLPVLARPLMQHDFVHVSLAGFVLTFCLMAYIPGYLKHHDKRLILAGLVGVSLVFFATFVARYWGEIAEAGIITLGNTVLIFGHMLNRRLLAHAKCKHTHH